MLSNFMTQSQIDRERAKKAASGKTEEGKKKSALNAMRHGLTGATFLMKDEDRAAWEAFSKPLIDSLKPADPMELQLAQLIAQDNYRINRIHAIEENTFSLGNCGGVCGEDVFLRHDRTFQNLSLYEQRISRNMHKNLKALQELQDRRKSEERQTPRESIAKPKTFAAGAGAQSDQQQSDNENKFVFSNPQTASEIVAPAPTNLDPQQHNPDREAQKAA